jgi:hypothetical protein
VTESNTSTWRTPSRSSTTADSFCVQVAVVNRAGVAPAVRGDRRVRWADLEERVTRPEERTAEDDTRDLAAEFGWLAGTIDAGDVPPPETPVTEIPVTEVAGEAPGTPGAVAAPWFTDHDALGDTAIERVDLPADATAAAVLADRVIQGLPAEVGARIRAAIRRQLVVAFTPSAAEDLAADPDIDNDRWTGLLQTGMAFEADGHLVWLHPVLRDFRHVTPDPAAEGGERPREYPVSFGGSSASRTRETETTRAYEAAANSIFGLASSAVSSVLMGLPRLQMSSSSGLRRETKVEAIAGRKSIADRLESFAAGLDIRVFVDGTRAYHDVSLPDMVRVPFPESFLRRGDAAVRPSPVRPPAHVVPAARARQATRFHLVVNAVQAERVAVELQQRLLAAKLPAQATAEILSDLLPNMFGEQSLKNGATWWTTSGRASDPVHARTGLARSFKGHARVIWRLRRLEYEDTSPATIRDDLGLLGTRRSGTSFAASFKYTHGVQAGGIEGDDLFGKGYLHGGMSMKWSRSHSVAANSETLPKATLTRRTPLTRYRAVADLSIQVDSSTHRVRSFEVPVTAEVAVPQDQARDFEAALFGEVRSPHLHALDPVTAAGTPEMRTLLEQARQVPGTTPAERTFGFQETPLPGGVTVRTPEQLETFALRSREPLMIRRSAWADDEEPPAWRTALGLAARGLARLFAADYTELDVTGAPRGTAAPVPARWQPRWAGLDPRHQFVIGADGTTAGPFPPGRVVHSPDRREPPALAAGVGTGLGHVTRLPGAERVLAEIRGVVFDRLGTKVSKAPEWAQVDRELDLNFGAPALEADLTGTLTGIDYTTTLNGYTVDVSVTGELGSARGAEEHDLTVNARAVAGEGASADRGDAWETALEIDGRARLGDLGRTNIEIGKLTLGGGYGRSKKLAWSGGGKGYRRTETAGPAVEITREMRYRVAVRIRKKGKPVGSPLRRDVAGEDTLAKVAVPAQHQPENPPLLADLPDVGRLERLPAPPAPERVTDLSMGAPGLYTAIVALPQLALRAGEEVAKLTGRPAPRERWDVPAEIRDVLRPSFIEANLAALTGEEGMFVELFERDGRSYSLQLKVRAVDTELVQSADDVELEHYASGNSKLGTARGSDRSLTGAAALGLRVRVKNKHEASEEPGEEIAEETRRGTDQVKFQGVLERSVKWSDTDDVETGGVDVSRATYAGTAHTYRSGLVFEMRAISSKNGRRVRTGESAFFQVHKAMDFMAPDRLAADLGLPRPFADAPERARRTYVDPELAIGSSYPELLDARSVLPALTGLLRDRRVLAPDEHLTTSPRMQVLRSRYSQEALRRQHLTLLGSGVLAWIPMDVGFGVTRYVGIRVRGELVPTTDVRQRREAKLMLRSQGIDVRARKRKRVVTTALHGIVYGAGFVPERFGGGSVEAGGTAKNSVETAKKVDVKDISRVTARDRSHEFNHRMRYAIEVVGTTELPAGVRQLASASRRGLLGIGNLLGSDALERFWYGHRIVWTASSRDLDGSVRLLVPDHVTTAVDDPATAAPGRRPVKAGHIRWDDVRPSPVETDLAPLIGQVDFAAAPLVAEWAPYVTIPLSRRPADPLTAARPPGYELSTGRGIRLAESASSANLRAKIKRLLAHTFTIPLAKGDISVGVVLHRAVKLTEAELKGRSYTQTKTGHEHEEEHSSGRDVRVDGLGGREDPGVTEEGEAVPYERAWDTGEGRAAESSNILERNSESTRVHDYYAFDLTLVFHGPDGGHLAMRVERGLTGRIARSDVHLLRTRDHFAGFFHDAPRVPPRVEVGFEATGDLVGEVLGAFAGDPVPHIPPAFLDGPRPERRSSSQGPVA